MKKPNYTDTQSKHPIPHAKGIAKDDNLNPKSQVSGEAINKSEEEEE